jgi:hypothetical protein
VNVGFLAENLKGKDSNVKKNDPRDNNIDDKVDNKQVLEYQHCH